MLKLIEDFYIISIERNWNGSILENKTTYTFRYKNYKIELIASFIIIAYTKEDQIAIINFGYVVDIEKWSNRKQCFEHIPGLKNKNGCSTKKYLDSSEAREIILKFLERFIDKYLGQIKPSIVIRGLFTNINTKLPRYTRFDTPFFDHGYIKEEFDFTIADSLFRSVKAKEDKELWIYCKKESYYELLSQIM